MTGFDGHTKRSTLNYAVYLKFSDRAVEVRICGSAQDLRGQQASLSVGFEIRDPPMQNIRTKL